MADQGISGPEKGRNFVRCMRKSAGPWRSPAEDGAERRISVFLKPEGFAVGIPVGTLIPHVVVHIPAGIRGAEFAEQVFVSIILTQIVVGKPVNHFIEGTKSGFHDALLSKSVRETEKNLHAQYIDATAWCFGGGNVATL